MRIPTPILMHLPTPIMPIPIPNQINYMHTDRLYLRKRRNRDPCQWRHQGTPDHGGTEARVPAVSAADHGSALLVLLGEC